MRKHLVSTLLGLALATAPVLLLAEEAAPEYPACDREPTAADIEGAQGAFKAGNGSYAEADYRLAITYWEDAYRRDCTAHELLMNLAQAYQTDGQPKRTIKALETFNARSPKDPRVPANERRIAKLREGIERAEAAAAPIASTTPAPSTTTTATAPPDEPGEPSEPVAEGSRPLTPLFVAGGGAVLGLIGGFLYLQGSGDLSDVEERCPNRECVEDADIQAGNDARSKTTLGGILGLGGSLVAGAGIVWYFLSPKSSGDSASLAPKRRGTRIQPAVGRGFTGLSVSGHF